MLQLEQRQKHKPFCEQFDNSLRIYWERYPDNKQSDIYKSVGLSKQTFSKIRSNTNPDYHPKKKNVLLIAIGLHLNVVQTEALLASAGYVFDKKSKAEMIVKKFLEQRDFNMQKIEESIYQECGMTLRNYGDVF